MTTTTRHDTLIIGAGLSGLMAANVLKNGGLDVLTLDKSRSTGGRLATRRVGPGIADHGAQFFTVRHPDFAAYVQMWEKAGIAKVWSHGWSDGSLATAPRDGHARYMVRGGMNALAGYLESGINVRVNVQIAQVSYDGSTWQAMDTNGVVFSAEKLLLTPPVPQSFKLLDGGGVELPSDVRAALEKIVYEPCLCAMVWVAGDVFLPEPGALQRPRAEIAWVADNQRKGISPAARIITMHAGGEFSESHYDMSDEALKPLFMAQLVPFMKPEAHIHDMQIKRWRYAQPTVMHNERCMIVPSLKLVFAGDAFFEPRVEGATLSGLAAGRALLAIK
jgi:renalase